MLGQHPPHVHRSQNVTDFSDAPVAAMIGNGWSVITTATTNISAAVVAHITSLSGRRANIVKLSANSYRALKWDRIASVADVEVLALLHLIDDPAAGETTGQIEVRLDTDGDPYYIGLPRKVATTKRFEIGRGDGAGGGVTIGNVTKAWDNTNLWWLRFRVIGNTQKGRMWQYQTTEPTTWENDFTDTNVPSAGFVGVGMFYTDATYALLWYSVATGGNTAPAPGG